MDRYDKERVLVVGPMTRCDRTLPGVLAGAGYLVFPDYLKGMKSVLDFSPDDFGGMPAAKARLDQWLKEESGKDQPVATHWK